MLVRNPGNTFVTVLALALGIGVNTAVFTGIKAMVTRPLDAQAPGEMVNMALKRDSGASQFSFSYPDYEAFRNLLPCFSGLVAYRPAQLVYSEQGSQKKPRAPLSGNLLGRMGLFRQGVGSAEFATVFVVSENYFRVLGVKMLAGRSFESISTDELSANPPVLLSENYWQKRFGGDPAVIGRTVYLNGVPVTITGITPHDFAGTGIGTPAFWLPAGAEPLVHADAQWLRNRENQPYRLFARLAPGVTLVQARAQVNSVAEHLRSLHDPRTEWANPATALVWPGSPFPLPLKEYGGLTLAVLLVMGAAGMVLVVACANVGSLQLARSRSREHEMRTRMSLGASRLRLIRQLITESALIGALAGGVALLITSALLKSAVAMMANAIPGEYGGLVFDVTPDLEIFAFVLAVSLVAGLLSGFAPAMESSKLGLSSTARSGTASARSRRSQDALVVAQVALSLVLMVAASMAIRSSIRLVAIDTGYESKRAFAMYIQFPETLRYDASGKRRLIQEFRDRLMRTPGIVAVTNAQPPGDSGYRTAAAAVEEGPSRTQTLLHYAHVESNYFDTVGIPLVQGRGLPEIADHSVVLSESAAGALWPGQNPIGRFLQLGPTDERSHNARELVANGSVYIVLGVVRDTRAAEFGAPDSKRVYLPMPADAQARYPTLVRTRSDPAQVIRSLDAVLTSIDPNIMADCVTLEEMQRQSAPFIVAALTALIASAIGLLGLLLALMGIYGTVNYIVVLRTREVGIRMAIGAQKRDVLTLILGESVRPILGGLMVGSLLAAGASYLARGLLYGLSGVDWITLAVDSLAFLTIGMLASYPPARRATRVDPQIALRYE